jgi:hypothetical protein
MNRDWHGRDRGGTSAQEIRFLSKVSAQPRMAVKGRGVFMAPIERPERNFVAPHGMFVDASRPRRHRLQFRRLPLTSESAPD